MNSKSGGGSLGGGGSAGAAALRSSCCRAAVAGASPGRWIGGPTDGGSGPVKLPCYIIKDIFIGPI